MLQGVSARSRDSDDGGQSVGFGGEWQGERRATPILVVAGANYARGNDAVPECATLKIDRRMIR